MRKFLLLALCALFSPLSADATLIGDSISGCFSDTGCAEGVGGSFTSSGATVSEVAIEFSGTESGFELTADVLTSGGKDVIRITFTDPGGFTKMPPQDDEVDAAEDPPEEGDGQHQPRGYLGGLLEPHGTVNLGYPVHLVNTPARIGSRLIRPGDAGVEPEPSRNA